jgi:hypothetical protein
LNKDIPAEPEPEKPKRKRRTREEMQAQMAAPIPAETSPELQDGEELQKVIEDTLPEPAPVTEEMVQPVDPSLGEAQEAPLDPEYVDITPEDMNDYGIGAVDMTAERNGLYRTLFAKADAYGVAKGISRQEARAKTKSLSYSKFNVRSMRQLKVEEIAEVIEILHAAIEKYSTPLPSQE